MFSFHESSVIKENRFMEAFHKKPDTLRGVIGQLGLYAFCPRAPNASNPITYTHR